MQTQVTARSPGVVLREVRDEDLPLLFGLRRDLSLQSLLLTVPEALDDAALRAWVERRRSEPGGAFLVAEDIETGRPIGYGQVTGVHRRNGSGYGGFVLLPAARGRGLGKALLERLIEVGKATLGLRKLLAEIRSDNTPSLRLHDTLGYRQVGTLKGHFVDRDGTCHDVLLLERMLEGP